MNYIYVDGSKDSNGNGTAFNPYNSLQYVFDMASLPHPCTIFLKRGQTYQLNKNLEYLSITYNTTDSMSYLDAYGVGPLPVVDGNDDSILKTLSARKFTFKNILFTSSCGKADDMFFLRPMDFEGDEIADVWFEDCVFKGKFGKNSRYWTAIVMDAWGEVDRKVNSFGLRRCKFIDVPKGAWLRGNKNSSSTSTGYDIYSKGVRAEECSGVNVAGDVVIISNATSDINPLIGINENTSGIFNGFSNSMRVDAQLRATVAFWLSDCRFAVIDHSTVLGTQGANGGSDKQAFDLDILCNHCVVQYCYSSNNAGFFLTSNWAGQVKPKPENIDVLEWYYNQLHGGVNNTVRYCISFNDGCQPGQYKLLLQGYMFNLKVQNCTFIDTVSKDASLVCSDRDWFNQVNYNQNLRYATFENVIFYAPNASKISFYGGYTREDLYASHDLKNSLIFSKTGVVPNVNSQINQSNNLFVDPDFINMPNSSPSSIELANKLTASINSMIRSAGIHNDYPDFNGKSGNSIGAIQF